MVANQNAGRLHYILEELDYIETDEVYTVEIYHYLHSNTVGIGVLDAARVEIRTALPYQHRR